MLQQIKNTKSDKQLTQNDLARIAYAGCLNLFHTNSMFKPWPLGMYFVMDIVYVKKISEDSYQFQTGWGSTESSYLNEMPKYFTSLVTKNTSEIQKDHPDIVCNKIGEEKLRIDCSYRKANNFGKSKLGFLITSPQSSFHYSYLFRYTLVIAPKPGLFPGRNE